jgi:hypothetical protein
MRLLHPDLVLGLEKYAMQLGSLFWHPTVYIQRIVVIVVSKMRNVHASKEMRVSTYTAR